MSLFDMSGSKVDKTPVRKDRAAEISHKNSVDNRTFRLDRSIALYNSNKEDDIFNIKFDK